MITQATNGTLDEIVDGPDFRVTGRGDTFFVTAPVFTSRRAMLRGELTPVGEYLQNEKIVIFDHDRLDITARTHFRGQ